MLKDLISKEFVGELTEGVHNATLTAWQYMANKDDAEKDYIKCTFNVENNGTQQVYNRNQFERDISIMLSQLRRQLGRSRVSINPKALIWLAATGVGLSVDLLRKALIFSANWRAA